MLGMSGRPGIFGTSKVLGPTVILVLSRDVDGSDDSRVDPGGWLRVPDGGGVAASLVLVVVDGVVVVDSEVVVDGAELLVVWVLVVVDGDGVEGLSSESPPANTMNASTATVMRTSPSTPSRIRNSGLR